MATITINGAAPTDDRLQALRGHLPAQTAALGTQADRQGQPVILPLASYERANGITRKRSCVAPQYLKRSGQTILMAAAVPSTYSGWSANGSVALDPTAQNNGSLSPEHYFDNNVSCLVKAVTAYCSGYLNWNGLNFAIPADGLMMISVRLDDVTYKSSIELYLKNGGGQIVYKFSGSMLKPGWNQLPMWNPNTDAHFSFHNPGGGCEITQDTGFNWAQNITGFTVSTGMDTGSSMSFGPIVAPAMAKGIVLFSNDYSGNTFGTGLMWDVWDSLGMKMTVRWGGVNSLYGENFYLTSMRNAIAKGHSMHNGTYDRQYNLDSSTEDSLRRTLLLCQNAAYQCGVVPNGMVMGSAGGNAIAPFPIMRKVCAELGIKLFRTGSGAPVNVCTAMGVDEPLALATTGLDDNAAGTVTVTADAAVGATVITTSGGAIGFELVGAAFAAGTYVKQFLNNKMTISAPLVAAITANTVVTHKFSNIKRMKLLDGLAYTGGLLQCFTHNTFADFAVWAQYVKDGQTAGKWDVLSAEQVATRLSGV